MSNDKHTPTPWRFDKDLEYIYDADNDYPILEAFSIKAAEKAVELANQHDGLIETIATLRAEKAELIEALRGAWDALKEADRRFSVKTGNALSEQITQTLAKIETK